MHRCPACQPEGPQKGPNPSITYCPEHAEVPMACARVVSAWRELDAAIAAAGSGNRFFPPRTPRAQRADREVSRALDAEAKALGL